MAPVLRVTLAVASIAGPALAGCDERGEDRDAQIQSVLAAADEPLIRTRPNLVAGKYARMAAGTFDFYRGNVPLYRSDQRSGTSALALSAFALDVPLVPSLGDPHPENFGVLRASDGSLAIEPNDFDSADRAPYLWDVRRLLTGLVLAARIANPEDAEARARSAAAAWAIARAGAAGYLAALDVVAGGGALERIERSDNPVLAEAFERSARDWANRRELEERTVLEGDVRRLRRGVLDPEDPDNVYLDLAPELVATLPVALARYRTTLAAPPPPEALQVLDAVRELGSGVASWPRVRVIALVRGASDAPDDDVLLEIKEVADSFIAGLFPPGVYSDSVRDRVVRASRAAWARPDAEAWWGMTEWLGVPFQVRMETEGQKGLNVGRLEEELGTPEALADLGRILGGVVARVHTRDPEGERYARAIRDVIDVDRERFLDEQADVALVYADQTEADRAALVRVLRRAGYRLGIPVDPGDARGPDLAALFGAPPLPALP